MLTIAHARAAFGFKSTTSTKTPDLRKNRLAPKNLNAKAQRRKVAKAQSERLRRAVD